MKVQQRSLVVLRALFALLALAVSTRATALPSGFEQILVANGLTNPTAMQFAPDGRLFVCEQAGQLRVIKNGALLPTPFLTVTVSAAGERGLLGVAFDPAFTTNHFVYIYYTATTPAIHNRISRFTANGDVAVAGSEVVIFDLDNLSSATNHNGGAIAFGPDGKLYAAVGENANGANSQSFNNVLGKMLRMNSDGTIPGDNPFLASTTGKNRAIWALGLRNPFTFAFNPAGSELFINDVGETTWEEIDNGIAGANYGWPNTEGPTQDPRYVSPLYAYTHSGGVCAITGGAFYAPMTTQFPSEYLRDYFFADYCGGWIRQRDTSSGSVATFATGLSFPVDLKVGDEGSLYVLARGAGAVYKIQYVPSDPVITTHPASQTVAPGGPVTFSVRATSTSPLRYQWQRNGTDIAGATANDYTIASVAAADNGARFRAVVTNDFSSVISNEAILTVTGGAPRATLLTTQTPAQQDVSDGVMYELGVRVMSDVDGQITALRFWKGPSETGAHTGHVWTRTGQLLATVSFANESASGWQEQALPAPVAMVANTEYVVSVSTPSNNYFVLTRNVFTTPLVNGPLRGLSGGNGVFAAAGVFPSTASSSSSNYFRDLVFVAAGGGGVPAPGAFSKSAPADAATGQPLSVTASWAASSDAGSYEVCVDTTNDNTCDGSWTSTAGLSATLGGLAAGTTYYWQVRAVNATATTAANGGTWWRFTTQSGNPGSSQTLLTTQTPALENVNDGVAYELGVRVMSDVDGQITALRFWKGASESGIHIGHVWTNTGQLLATVTFTNENASGWQQQALAAPVTIVANTEYVVSVTTSNNYFVLTRGVFTTPLVNAHLRGLAGGNGVVGSAGAFPSTPSSASSNYFRDLVFVPQ